MRFTENGCNIPDELIQAREAGQVVFFCGAGVSKNAGLPELEAIATADQLFTLLEQEFKVEYYLCCVGANGISI